MPDIPKLRDVCRSMAVLEAILSPDWESRHHSFDGVWGPGEGFLMELSPYFTLRFEGDDQAAMDVRVDESEDGTLTMSAM